MFKAIEPLTELHVTDPFDCGKDELNRFIKQHALRNQGASVTRVFVLCQRDNRVLAYHGLAAGSVEHVNATARVTKGLAKYPVPVIILARLAVDSAFQRKGLGKALLKDAIRRSISASESIGARALLIHAKDQEAKTWYQQFDVEESPTDPLHLFLVMKDAKKLMRVNT